MLSPYFLQPRLPHVQRHHSVYFRYPFLPRFFRRRVTKKDMAATQSNPLVDVIWWTHTSLYVKCPYCEETHHHGFRSYEDGLRVPHCALRNRPAYRYKFPIAYEIDKNKARFININTVESLGSDAEDDSDDEAPLAGQLSNLALSGTSNEPEITFDDSEEKIVARLEGEEPFEAQRISLAISNCVTGSVSSVKHYLEDSPDKSIFINGRDHRGDTCLIMASREASSSMVSLLLDYGAEVDARNKRGRSALMEASLWGRLETAQILLSRGADKNLQDKKNRRALDLTQPTLRNRKERHTVAGGVWGDSFDEPIYKEDFVSREADRREIARILGKITPPVGDREPQEPDATAHSFRRSTNGFSITQYWHGPVRQHLISRSFKTIAVLERGSPFPPVVAMSGWGHSQCSSTRVSGRNYTGKVFRLAEIVGHDLAVSDSKDHGIRGQHYASHAEKQLIAYFIDRHVFLPEDKTSDPRFQEQIGGEKSEIAILASQYSSVSKLFQLQGDMKSLVREIWDKDDRMLGDEYDEDLVRRLKTQVTQLRKRIATFETRPEIQELRTRERQIQLIVDERERHKRLNHLSTTEPERPLRRATILICAPKREICKDCTRFVERINHYFGLQITLCERSIE